MRRDAGPRYLIGPPGSGKTEAAAEAARIATRAGRRVVWLGLPHQRDHLRRLVQSGPLLGLRFLNRQQLALAQLTRAGRLRPPLVATARLAAIAAVLRELDGAPPSPGEASAFAAAIGEVKRYGLTPDALTGADRLARVFAHYERRKGDLADEEDTLAAALADARVATPEALRDRFGADVLIVDGWREVTAFDAAYFAAIARGLDVLVTAALPPRVADAAITPLDARPGRVDAWRFPNPIAEARWLLRAVARDLSNGLDPRDVAVVAPPGTARTLLALAPEHGVPFADHTPRALADTPFGRTLTDLIELPQVPTAGRLLALPALAALGRAALDAGVAGRPAIAALADRYGLTDPHGIWATLTPGGDLIAWARAVVSLAGDLLPREGEAALARAQESALRRAQEAFVVTRDPDGFRAWWLAMLRAAAAPARAEAGVPLLPPPLAAGRRFRRCYVAGAVALAYDLGESEDAFFAEDVRGPEPITFPAGHLPRRLRGMDAAWRADLRARADHVTVTAPAADRGGPLRLDPILWGPPSGEPPPLPSASPLEASTAPPYRPPAATAIPDRVDVDTLRRADPCPFAAWASAAWMAPGATEAERARADLVAHGPPGDAFARAHPRFAAWASAHRPALTLWRYRERLHATVAFGRVEAPLHAVRREGERVTIVAFLLPTDPLDAPIRPDLRWNELWAADLLRRRYPRLRIDLLAWPLGGEPHLLTPEGVDEAPVRLRRERIRTLVANAAAATFAEPPAARPGWYCRGCPAADFCRVAEDGA